MDKKEIYKQKIVKALKKNLLKRKEFKLKYSSLKKSKKT